MHFTYMNCRFADSVDSELELEVNKIVPFVLAALEKKERTLVHCMGGVSRSPAVVVALLVSIWKKSLDDAIALVTLVRPGVKLDRFLPQLQIMFNSSSINEEKSK